MFIEQGCETSAIASCWRWSLCVTKDMNKGEPCRILCTTLLLSLSLSSTITLIRFYQDLLMIKMTTIMTTLCGNVCDFDIAQSG